MEENREQWKSISIVGRYVYGLFCLQKVLKKEGLLENEGAQFILTKLWEFSNLEFVDEWYETAKYLSYHFYFNEDIEGIDNPVLTEDHTYKNEVTLALGEGIYSKIRDFYKLSSTSIKLMITHLLELGRSNIYGTIDTYSKNTYDELMKILNTMSKLKLSLPPVDLFLTSEMSFTNEIYYKGGWGIPVSKSYFQVILDQI